MPKLSQFFLGFLNHEEQLPIRTAKIMTTERFNALDKVTHHQPSDSASTHLLQEALQLLSAPEKKHSSSSSAQSLQFLDMGSADDLYGKGAHSKGAHDAVHKMADQQFDLGKAVQGLAAGVMDAGKHAIENVVGKEARHVQDDTKAAPSHVVIPDVTPKDPNKAFDNAWWPKMIEDGKKAPTWTPEQLEKWINTKAQHGKDYYYDLPPVDIDPGFKSAESKDKRDIDPGFQISTGPKGKQVLTQRQIDDLEPIR